MAPNMRALATIHYLALLVTLFNNVATYASGSDKTLGHSLNHGLSAAGIKFSSRDPGVSSGRTGRVLIASDTQGAAGNLEELLCDRFTGADNASSLVFAIARDEIVTSEKSFYFEYDGEIFSDNTTRKVWTGRVVNDTVGTLDRTISLAWGEVCNAETFLLKIVTNNDDGTISVTKTIPCDEEGGDTGICIVKVEIGPLEEGLGLIPPTSSRRLRAARRDMKNEVAFEPRDTSSAERRLQSCSCDSSPEVDVMLLYTEDARDRLGGVSDSQMETLISEAFSSSKEAMENSNIALSLRLVHVQLIELSLLGSDELAIERLRVDEVVGSLRDTYRADLVQLIHVLEDSCSIGYVSSGNPDFAFSVVDPDCLDKFSHTHELGHNLGCDNNREDATTNTDYAYGFRYCNGTDPFVTIMAHTCNNVSRINWFSNPDITYLDKPTGQEDADCARAIEDNMANVCMYRGCKMAPTTTPITSSTNTPTTSPTGTSTASPTGTPTASPTATPTVLSASGPTPSRTRRNPTPLPAPASASSLTLSPAPSPAGTYTPSPTGTHTPLPTGAYTPSLTGTYTPSPTGTYTPPPAGAPASAFTPGPTSPPTSALSPTVTSTRGGYCMGDPHCYTFDGVYYDCQGQGDFALVEVVAAEAEVQARFEQSKFWSPSVTVTTAVAAREGNSSLVEVTRFPETEVLVDGTPYDNETVANRVTLQVSESSIIMEFLSGLKIQYNLTSWGGSVFVYVPTTLETSGLLGNNNGNWNDDWQTSAGEVLTLSSTVQSRAEGTDFCTSQWRRTDSLFTTASPDLVPAVNETYTSVTLPEVVPENVTELCGENTACIFDTIVAGPEVGAETLEAIEKFVALLADEGGLCEQNTFSVDGAPPCTDCPQGETSGLGATACVPSQGPTPVPTPAPTTPAPTTGLNPCLDSTNPDYRCTGKHSGETIDLKWCGLTDDDANMLRACFEVPGNGDVSQLDKIKLIGNDLTTVPSGSITGMTNLTTINLRRICGLTCVPATETNTTIYLSDCSANAADTTCE